MIPPRPGAVDIFEIYTLLMRLGVSANYAGFRQTAYAIYLAVQDPDRLMLVSKWLYPEVAKHYETTWKAVERNIRTVVTVAWEKSPGLLSVFAGHLLTEKPRPAQFIAILVTYLLYSPYSV